MYYIKNHRLDTLFSDSPDYVSTNCMIVSKAIAFKDRPLFTKNPGYEQSTHSPEHIMDTVKAISSSSVSYAVTEWLFTIDPDESWKKNRASFIYAMKTCIGTAFYSAILLGWILHRIKKASYRTITYKIVPLNEDTRVLLIYGDGTLLAVLSNLNYQYPYEL